MSRAVIERTGRRTRVLARVLFGIVGGRKNYAFAAPALWGLVAGLVWLAAHQEDLGWRIWPSIVLFAGLVAILLFDVRYLILPDGPMVVVAAGGVAAHWGEPLASLATFGVAAACAFALFRGMDLLYQRWRGVAGLGQGDAWLFAIAGLWVGPEGLPGVLIISVASATTAVMIASFDRRRIEDHERIAFAPHLGLGLWLTWVVGPVIFGA